VAKSAATGIYLLKLNSFIFDRRDAECTAIDFIGFSLRPLCLCGETKRKVLSRTVVTAGIPAELAARWMHIAVLVPQVLIRFREGNSVDQPAKRTEPER
jgi:hypothetical protein